MKHLRVMKKLCREFMAAAKDEFKETLDYWNTVYLEQAEDMQDLQDKCAELEDKILNLSSKSGSSDSSSREQSAKGNKNKGFNEIFKMSKTLQPNTGK